MTSEQIRAAVMAKRSASGLVLRFNVPGRPDDLQPFVMYPKSEEDKIRWRKNALRDGWIEV